MDESAQGTTQSADGNQDVDILYLWKIPVDRTYVKSIIGVLKVVIAVSSYIKGFTHPHPTHTNAHNLSLSHTQRVFFRSCLKPYIAIHTKQTVLAKIARKNYKQEQNC